MSDAAGEAGTGPRWLQPGAPGHPTRSPHSPDLQPPTPSPRRARSGGGGGRSLMEADESPAVSSPPCEGLSGTILRGWASFSACTASPSKGSSEQGSPGAEKNLPLCPSLGCLSSLEKVGAQAPGFGELRL